MTNNLIGLFRGARGFRGALLDGGYEEGLAVAWRGLDAAAAAFPFGHGLSYAMRRDGKNPSHAHE